MSLSAFDADLGTDCLSAGFAAAVGMHVSGVNLDFFSVLCETMSFSSASESDIIMSVSLWFPASEASGVYCGGPDWPVGLG